MFHIGHRNKYADDIHSKKKAKEGKERTVTERERERGRRGWRRNLVRCNSLIFFCNPSNWFPATEVFLFTCKQELLLNPFCKDDVYIEPTWWLGILLLLSGFLSFARCSLGPLKSRWRFFGWQNWSGRGCSSKVHDKASFCRTESIRSFQGGGWGIIIRTCTLKRWRSSSR